MQYPKTPHSHIVPAGYLRSWAADDRIAMRLIGDHTSRLVGLRAAGVRSDFYKRERPGTGEVIYDIEWSLRELENVAVPVVRNLARRWPINDDDKCKVGQFFATQYVRGPAFKAWHEQFLATSLQSDIDEMRSNPDQYWQPRSDMTAAEAVERGIEHLRGDTYRNLRMLNLTRLGATLLASMHWTLVEFDQARLITSDQPVVMWPRRRARSRPEPTDINAGVLDTLEVFVPVGPTHLLLMTWLDKPDPDGAVRGSGRHISTANAFVMANADRQWFHHPGIAPWRLTKGPRDPLSMDLVAGYDADVALRSKRRIEAASYAKAEAGASPSNDPITMITVA